MSKNNQFQKPLKLMKVALLLSGIKLYQSRWHPFIEALVNHFIYYVNIIILHTVILAEIYWLLEGIQIGRDFVGMSLTAPCITISILSTLKAMPLYFKRDVVREIVHTLEEIHPKTPIARSKTHHDNSRVPNKGDDFVNVQNATDSNSYQIDEEILDVKNEDGETKPEEQIENGAVKLLSTVGFLLTWISVLVLVTFLLAPLVMMYWVYFAYGEWKIEYPFSVKYWFDAYESELWPWIYFHQVWATVIVGYNLYATETLFYTLCTYLEMHFLTLSQRFENIPSGATTRQILDKNVKEHQLLIQLVDKTETLFSVPVLLHIVSSSFLICLSAFNITVVEDLTSLLAFISFLMLSLSQVSLLCWFGDKLMRSSTAVCDGVYKCPWYNFDVNTKKAVLIIVMRSQKPCVLTACNFADLNLAAFTTILSRSWSYFALLKTVYK